MKRSLVFLTILVLLVSSFAQAQKRKVNNALPGKQTVIQSDPGAELKKLPTWPQDFSLTAGEHATFGIPNPGTGVIKVTVTWTGSPLNIGVVDTDAKPVIQTASKAAPSYNFEIGANFVSQPNYSLFVVQIELPQSAGANAKVTGKINVESDAPNVTRFQEQIKPFMARQVSKSLELTPQQAEAQTIQARAAIDAKNLPLVDQQKTLAQSLQVRVATEIKQRSTILSAKSKVTRSSPAMFTATLDNGVQRFGPKGNRAGLQSITAIGSIGALKPSAVNQQQGGNISAPAPSMDASVNHTAVPALQSVTPTTGMTGEQVTIVGKGLKENSTEVYFSLAPTATQVPAGIASFSTAADGTVTMKVVVPGKDGITSPFAGQIIAKATDRNPAVTTTGLNFNFVPIVPPSVSYIDPVQVKSGSSVTIDGNNFKQGDAVHFVIPGVSDYAAPTQFVNATRLTATVQHYTSKNIVNGSIYIARQVPAGWIVTQPFDITFNPTLPMIQEAPASETAENPFIIRGMSFGGTGSGAGAGAGGAGGGNQGAAGGNEGAAGASSQNDMAMAEANGNNALSALGTAQGAGASANTPAVAVPPGAEVHIVDHKGQDHKMVVSFWSDTHIVAQTPEITGFINPVNCQIYVKTSAGKGDPKPITLKPAQVKTLLFIHELYSTLDFNFSSSAKKNAYMFAPTPNMAIQIVGYHEASLFIGHSGDDKYFINRHLQNGWVVDSIDFNGSNCRLDESRVGTDSPYARVHWWCDAPYRSCSYTMMVWVKGPKGTWY